MSSPYSSRATSPLYLQPWRSSQAQEYTACDHGHVLTLAHPEEAMISPTSDMGPPAALLARMRAETHDT